MYNKTEQEARRPPVLYIYFFCSTISLLLSFCFCFSVSAIGKEMQSITGADPFCSCSVLRNYFYQFDKIINVQYTVFVQVEIFIAEVAAFSEKEADKQLGVFQRIFFRFMC